MPAMMVRLAPLALSLAACTPAAEQAATIDAAALIALDKAGKVAIVDVREPDEYAAGHIPGAASRPLSSFDCRDLQAPAGKEIVLQCRSGRRSAEALAACQAAGRTDIRRHLAGGIKDWEAAGGPVTTAEGMGQ